MDLQKKLEETIKEYNDINRRVGEAEIQIEQLRQLRTQNLGRVQLLQELISSKEPDTPVETVSSTPDDA